MCGAAGLTGERERNCRRETAIFALAINSYHPQDWKNNGINRSGMLCI